MPESLTTSEVAVLARVTYRQLDHWIGKGDLAFPDAHPGSGTRRRWTEQEVDAARVFAALVHHGLTPAAACEAVVTARVGYSTFVVSLGTLDIFGTMP